MPGTLTMYDSLGRPTHWKVESWYVKEPGEQGKTQLVEFHGEVVLMRHGGSNSRDAFFAFNEKPNRLAGVMVWFMTVGAGLVGAELVYRIGMPLARLALTAVNAYAQ